MKATKIISHIVKWLKNYSDKSNTEGFVIGISGGVDSALTSTLCAMTGKPTFCISLPINQEKNQLNNANIHIDFLKKKFQNVKSYHIDLSNVYQVFLNCLKNKILESPEIADINLKPRIRMSSLYYISATKNSLVVGTGNKIEDFQIGFFTKYGDGGVDISPIADLVKSQVYLLANELKIDKRIINAAPTDGLWKDNRTDEQQIGMNYNQIEEIMSNKTKKIEHKQKKFYDIAKKLKSTNSHKIQAIPICKIPSDL